MKKKYFKVMEHGYRYFSRQIKELSSGKTTQGMLNKAFRNKEVYRKYLVSIGYNPIDMGEPMSDKELFGLETLRKVYF